MNDTPLDPHDLYWIRRRLPRQLYELMKRHPGQLVVAGGFLRACVAGEKPSDVDVFMRRAEELDPKTYVELCRDMAKALLPTSRKLIVTDNAFTVRGLPLPVQFIHRWSYQQPADLLSSFDFTMAQAAIWYDPSDTSPETAGPGGWHSLAGPKFYCDLASKRLIYTKPDRLEEAGGSLLRILKFYQRGYRIPLDDLAAVIVRLLRGVHWPAMGVTGTYDEEQLQKILCGLLREVDPNTDPDHLSHLPSLNQMSQDEEQDDDPFKSSQTAPIAEQAEAPS